MKKTLFCILLIVLGAPVNGQDINEETLLMAMHSISSHDLLEYVKIQCDDKYQGRIILIEREAPVNPSAGPEKFNPWYEHSFHQTKLANAVRHGAIGMIYNYGPIANPNNDYYEKFIYVHIGDSVVKDIFSGTGVPSLSFYTYGSVNYYHISLDNIDIIKPEIMEDLCQLLFVAVVRMADSENPLR